MIVEVLRWTLAIVSRHILNTTTSVFEQQMRYLENYNSC